MTRITAGADDRREAAIRTIEEALAGAKVNDFLIHPTIPEVLVSPCFLVVPFPGSLLTIDVQNLPSDHDLWDFTLEIIEGLIEVKISSGFQTTVALFLLDWEVTRWKEDAIRLLEVMFDHVFILPAKDPDLFENLKRKTNDLLEKPEANINLMDFWKSELDQRHSNFQRIMKSPSVQGLVRQQKEKQKENKKRRSKQEVLNLISQIPGLHVKSNQKVFNIKEFLLNTPTEYYFRFDYSVFPQRITHIYGDMDSLDTFALNDFFGSGGYLSELIQGSEKKYTNTHKLRKLSTYARFISYRPGSQEQPLIPLPNLPNLNLIVDGNLIGPDFAPDRFILLLASTGWNLVGMDDLDEKAFNVGVHQ